MRFSINAFLLSGCFMLFMACKNESSSKKSTPSVSATSSSDYYKHFRGTVGTFPVTMDLVKTTTMYNSDGLPHFNGYCSYDKFQEPIPIYGTIEAGTVKLEESGGTSTGVFKGKFNANGSFTGIWEDTLKHVKYNFELQEATNDGAIALDVFTFLDSAKLFPTVKNSPQAEFSMDALFPAKNTEGSVFEFLKTEIIKELKYDSIAGDYKKLQIADVQKTARDSFFKQYREELKEETPDTSENYSLNYAKSMRMDVVSNTDGLLSLGFSAYDFTGGAHGNYGTKLVTYDIKNKKVITLNDLFKPNYQAVLNAAVNRSARRYFGVKEGESLEGSAFSEAIEANDNFIVTKKGILFDYVPYEIASYAQGEIQLYVPFEELKTILK